MSEQADLEIAIPLVCKSASEVEAKTNCASVHGRRGTEARSWGGAHSVLRFHIRSPRRDPEHSDSLCAGEGGRGRTPGPHSGQPPHRRPTPRCAAGDAGPRVLGVKRGSWHPEEGVTTGLWEGAPSTLSLSCCPVPAVRSSSERLLGPAARGTDGRRAQMQHGAHSELPVARCTLGLSGTSHVYQGLRPRGGWADGPGVQTGSQGAQRPTSAADLPAGPTFTTDTYITGWALKDPQVRIAHSSRWPHGGMQAHLAPRVGVGVGGRCGLTTATF